MDIFLRENAIKYPWGFYTLLLYDTPLHFTWEIYIYHSPWGRKKVLVILRAMSGRLPTYTPAQVRVDIYIFQVSWRQLHKINFIGRI